MWPIEKKCQKNSPDGTSKENLECLKKIEAPGNGAE